MQKVAVAIPVYKPSFDPWEEISLRQTMCVLGRYPMVLVCPDGMDSSQYDTLASAQGVALHKEGFEPRFFDGIKGYNQLMLSKSFYARFADYEYVLICQTDAYVFRDELLEWCGKDYDYVGAPIFGRFSDEVFRRDQGRVGNGGFSLRRVRAFLDFFDGKKNVYKIRDLAGRIDFKEKPQTRWLVWLLMVLGWRNKPLSVAKRWKYNEDDFWSRLLEGSNYELSKPQVDEAMLFAFERFPSEVFSITGKMPFGCHAWTKYQYESFWKDYIKE